MNKTIWGNYGKIAIGATKYIQQTGWDPEDAWYKIAKEIFKEKTASIDKDCPRNAYLGLCEDGLVAGVSKGIYVSVGNFEKLYAVKAIHILQRDQTLENNSKELWKTVMIDTGRNPNKTHNSQMNVVLALWHEGMIVRDSA